MPLQANAHLKTKPRNTHIPCLQKYKYITIKHTNVKPGNTQPGTEQIHRGQTLIYWSLRGRSRQHLWSTASASLSHTTNITTASVNKYETSMFTNTNTKVHTNIFTNTNTNINKYKIIQHVPHTKHYSSLPEQI